MLLRILSVVLIAMTSLSMGYAGETDNLNDAAAISGKIGDAATPEQAQAAAQDAERALTGEGSDAKDAVAAKTGLKKVGPLTVNNVASGNGKNGAPPPPPSGRKFPKDQGQREIIASAVGGAISGAGIGALTGIPLVAAVGVLAGAFMGLMGYMIATALAEVGEIKKDSEAHEKYTPLAAGIIGGAILGGITPGVGPLVGIILGALLPRMVGALLNPSLAPKGRRF